MPTSGKMKLKKTIKIAVISGSYFLISSSNLGYV